MKESQINEKNIKDLDNKVQIIKSFHDEFDYVDRAQELWIPKNIALWLWQLKWVFPNVKIKDIMDILDINPRFRFNSIWVLKEDWIKLSVDDVKFFLKIDRTYDFVVLMDYLKRGVSIQDVKYIQSNRLNPIGVKDFMNIKSKYNVGMREFIKIIEKKWVSYLIDIQKEIDLKNRLKNDFNATDIEIKKYLEITNKIENFDHNNFLWRYENITLKEILFLDTQVWIIKKELD